MAGRPLEKKLLWIDRMNYIGIYPDALAPQVCNQMIQAFEQSPLDWVQTDLDGTRHFTELNLSTIPAWKPIVDILIHSMQKLVPIYRETFSIADQMWPVSHGYEQFRMKRYLPNDHDEFGFHSDVGSYDSARRFLAFLWYLNDVKNGGETRFQMTADHDQAIRIAPRAGTVLMFPSLWTYPHLGQKPVSGPKWVVSGYLHYL